MLEYKISTLETAEQSYEAVPLFNKYRAEDGSFMSGMTLPSYGVQYESYLIGVYANNGFPTKVEIETEKVIRKGYVEYTKEYRMEEFVDAYGNIFHGVRYDDGVIYAVNTASTEPDGDGNVEIYEDGTVTLPCEIEGTSAFTFVRKTSSLGKVYSAVTCLHRDYIDNGEVTISGYTYNIDIDCDGDITYLFQYPKFTFNSSNTVAWTSDKWQELIKVVTKKKDKIELEIDQICCAEPLYYVDYGQIINENSLGQQTDFQNNRLYFQKYYDVEKNVEGLPIPQDTDDFSNLLLVELDGEIYSAYTDDDSIEIRGKKIPINYSWVNSNYSESALFLYVDGSKVLFTEGTQILAINKEGETRRYILTNEYGDEYVLFNGDEYVVSEPGDTRKYILISGATYNDDVEEYELTKEEGFNGSCIYSYSFNGKKNYIQLAEGKCTRFTINNVTIQICEGDTYSSGCAFDDSALRIKEYRYVEINGNMYNVIEENVEKIINGEAVDTTIKYVDIDEQEIIPLEIEEVTNNNQLRCYPLSSEISAKIFMAQQSNYTFYLNNSLIDYNNIGEYAYNDSITFYKEKSYFNLPLKFTFEAANNLYQEAIIKRDFYDYEREKSINSIVDMEKDIYYPTFVNGTSYQFLEQLSFYLHFRTRNLDDWKVIEDNTSGGTFTKDKKYQTNCNWNIIDYYYDNYNEFKFPDKAFKVLSGTTSKLYQPSDLLYYLNFDDDDVYYQKSRIKKSFLRLLFYDSDNPLTQSLLATSTIFLDGSSLFKKYCSNSNPDTYDKYAYSSMTDGLYNEYISVDREPCNLNDDYAFTFDDEKRLSATFNVQNIFDDKCSEGFYLYIFKEYSTALHERTIYMKIQFNHAGTGKVVNFFVPRDDDGNVLDLTDKDNRNTLKEGIPLEELATKLYVPVTVKFDVDKNKFIYTLPSSMIDKENNRCVFNLYEVKIKDES